MVCLAINTILQIINAIAVGSKQYPRTHTLWKNDLKCLEKVISFDYVFVEF